MKVNKLIIIYFFFISSFTPIFAQLQIKPAFPNLSFAQPVDIENPGDGTNRLFVVSQPGKIYVFVNDSSSSTAKVFLDITDRVLFNGEQGLLGLAFHPDYKNNGYFYVDYVADNPRRTIIARFNVSSANPDSADKNSQLVLLEQEQPYTNHNGGQIRFGPDGYLYIAFGDGGSGGDPQNHAQNLTSLLGKILRIDINKTTNDLNYSIPEDNPFVGSLFAAREEIYAYGLRNPWRFSFDPPTGRLWVADVGQNQWEEIDIVEKGKNYGWHIMEGLHCYNPSTGCDTTGLIMPIWEYGHNSQGGESITGGFVYRGKNAQEIYGKYIYADYESKKIWALDYDGSNINNALLFQTAYGVTTFGIDQNNELYFSDYGKGKIYKFKGTPVTTVNNETIPVRFNLEQNYPNPFNPETKIEFSIGQNNKDILNKISLKVYDVLGRTVAVLVDGYKIAGKYTVRFSASDYNLSSGIYFYQLRSGDLISTKKMLLLK